MNGNDGPAWIDGRLTAIRGDITTLDVDAVVNAANSSLLGGGGVDGAIHRAGGPVILEECRRIRRDTWPDGMPAGEAVTTAGGRLPAQYVIHTVGPVWHGGASGESEVLEAAYRNSLRRAREIEARTVAFPAISTGVYGYPPGEAARVVIKVMADELAKQPLPEKVILVFFSAGGLETFTTAAAL